MSSESIRNRVKRLLKKHGLKGVNKPKRTPQHPKKSHIVLAKEGNKVKLIRYGEQGASTAGKPKAGESARMKAKRASFKARHRRNIKKGKMSAAYWANKTKWFLLLPILSLQAQSWLNVEFVSDQYAAESSWEILADTNVVASGVAGESIINLPPGPYTFVAYDSFGDGICCEYGEGYIVLSNTCGLNVEVLDFNTAQLDIPINLFPCPPPVFGCMEVGASNYNPWANQDNGTCNVSECPEGEAFVSMELTLDNWPNETGFTLVDLAVGQFYEQVFPGEFNFGDQLATYTYDFCVSLGFELILTDTYGDGLNGSGSGGVADGGVIITACSDTVVWELEDIDFSDGSGTVAYSGAVFVDPCPVEPPVIGCMDDDYVDYNPEATEPGDCLTLHTWGCMDSTAFNYDSAATISDLNSPCLITITLEDDAGDGWGNSRVGVKQGESQWLFAVPPGEFSKSWDLVLDSDEEVDVYYFEIGGPQQPPQETEFQTLHNSITVTNEAGDTLMVEGENPFFDNGQGALQPFSQPNWNVYHFTPYCGTNCIPYIYGCLDTLAQNYDQGANTDDGGCYYAAGCMQAGYLEYYEQGYVADYDDGSCETLAVFGCTDPDAMNYDVEANVDNDSCIPFVLGCMDVSAYNYNPEANTEGDCLYDAGCATGPGNPYWLNDSCYAWVIEVDAYCCEEEWDGACIGLYDYCQQGWPTGVPDLEEEVAIRPTVVEHKFYVDSPYPFVLTVFDATGRELLRSSSPTQDASHWPVGTYHLIVVSDNRSFKQTIVKL